MKKKASTLSVRTLLILVIVALGLGVYYRGVGLESRPMHTDEAILAEKLGTLWTQGTFDYDPADYHGPALHQASWLYGKLAGWGDPSTWTASQLRHIPMLCGILLLLATMLFARPLGWHGVGIAMLLLAVSPMQVFYSRYFIMEPLLVLTLTLGLWALWMHMQTGGKGWLLLVGAALGFAHATKETFVINVFAGFCGYAVARFFAAGPSSGGGGLRIGGSSSRKSSFIKGWHLLLGGAALVSIACYTGLKTDFTDVKESLTTYTSYLQRSGGAGHEQPWHYYLTLLFYRSADGGVIWSEALIGLLGVIGIIAALFSQDRDGKRVMFMMFLAIYTVVLYAAYSFIRYKTPWSILSAHHALTLMAGYGAATLWQVFPGKIAHIVQRLIIIAGAYHMCAQSMLAIDQYRADSRNPFVYSHATTSLVSMVDTVRDLLRIDPALTVQVISRDGGWPLPWYFRGMQAGYHTTVPETLDGTVLIFDSELRPQIDERLPGREMQENGPYGLRPLVFMTMLVDKALWTRHMEKRQSANNLDQAPR